MRHFKRILVCILIFVMAFSLVACGSNNSSSNKSENNGVQNSKDAKQMRKVIIDTDTGGDDAAALIIAAKDEYTDILGVTVAAGNVNLDQAADNALMTLEMAGCNAPVYKGASSTYTSNPRKISSVFGNDGMGDHDMIHPTRKVEKESAVDFIIKTVKENPDEVEIIALGPVTNIALAFDKDPDTMKHVKKYWSMGTTGFGPGNVSPVAEFNVYHDVEAYKVFVDSGVPITAIGFDMLAEDTDLNKADLDEFEKKGGLFEYVAKALSGLVKFNKEFRGNEVANIPDAIAMACVLWDEYMTETKACHASVMTKNDETYGQVILYQKDYGYDSGIKFDDYSFHVVTKTASETFKSKFIKLLEK